MRENRFDISVPYSAKVAMNGRLLVSENALVKLENGSADEGLKFDLAAAV